MKEQYEQKLIEEKNRLSEELGNIGQRDENGEWGAKGTDVSESDADENNNADRFEDFEEKSSLVIPLEKRLIEVQTALDRISEGTYGTCVVCKKEIESERLAANPAAETCIAHMK
jgi:RNA polymerase-binding transcription factor DksA